MYQKLLEGAYDLHVHTGPDIPERKLDDLDYAERLQSIGMKGFGIKSHYFCTAERARIVKKLYPNLNPVGAITLNNSVGGINPTAVEMAARDGAKIVWMPTFDSENEIDYVTNRGSYEVLPPWAQVQVERKAQGLPQTSITILEDGKLKKPVFEILDLVYERDLILATGHLSKKEIYALAAAAKDRRVRKLLVTHPTFSSIAFTKEEQKELTELGAYMEHCFGCIDPRYGITWEELYEHIRYVGPEKTILSSDLGQISNPHPDEGLVEFVKNLAENGFSEEEIRTMTTHNTTFFVEG
jgi:Family of unknown function (DUF6282)